MATNNKKLLAWVEEVEKLCGPTNVHWCDGSDKKNEALVRRDGEGRNVYVAQSCKTARVFCRAFPSRATWRASKNEPTFAPEPRKPGRPTTGRTRRK